jgi:hypothetical protein
LFITAATIHLAGLMAMVRLARRRYAKRLDMVFGIHPTSGAG